MLLLHLKEIKFRVFYIILSYLLTFIINYLYHEELLIILNKPLIKSKIIDHFIYTNITEAFFSYLKLVTFISILFIIPIILLNIWLFLIPGLYSYERIKIEKIFIIFFILINLAIERGINYFIPKFYEFFIKFNSISEINNNIFDINILDSSINSVYIKDIELFHLSFEPKINEFITLIIQFLIILIVLIILPIILYNIKINIRIFIQLRKYIFILILIMAGIITPPSIINQIFISIPLIFTYELIIYLKIYKSQL
jgi:sec-independent protein translocase protein TatC